MQHPFDHLSAGSMSSWIPSPPAHPRDTRGPVGCVGYYPEGYRIRCMRIGEEAARVGVHRRAWRPASLPWPPEVDVSGISPAATRRFTAEHFQLLRRTWLYRQDLDLVVEAPDGALAGCCTVWWDPKVGCAEVEPLGVVPRYRRKGAWLRVVPGGRTTGLGQGWDPDVRERWAATGLSSTGRHLPPCGLRRRPPWHLFRPLSAGRVVGTRGNRRPGGGALPSPRGVMAHEVPAQARSGISALNWRWSRCHIFLTPLTPWCS